MEITKNQVSEAKKILKEYERQKKNKKPEAVQPTPETREQSIEY